jgi:Na+/phosphate symporter
LARISGTTVTGWLVAIVGFKLQLDTVVLPLIFIGASLKLFAGDKYSKTRDGDRGVWPHLRGH